MFSGEEHRQKNAASAVEWQYIVKCTQNEGIYPDHAIAQSIRRSLKVKQRQCSEALPCGATGLSAVRDCGIS